MRINYFIPERAFIYITSIATVCGLFVWGMIVFTHLRYRREVNAGRLPESEFRMPGTPAANWFVTRLPRDGAGSAGVQ